MWLLSPLVTTTLLLVAVVQWLSGKVSWAHTCNRMGYATDQRPKGRVIWFHAASLGELSSVRPFLVHLCQQNPTLVLLITTNNPAALAVAQKWPGISARFQAAPIDSSRIQRRFFEHWRPNGFVNIENEIWPNRFALLQANDVPAVMLNARLSARSARAYKKLPRVGRSLNLFRRIFAQDIGSANLFRTLGVSDGRIETCPNFKSLVQLIPPPPELSRAFQKKKTLLAASTHPGEDELVLHAFKSLQTKDPDLRMILVPRHPDRTEDIKLMCQSTGFSVSILSSGYTASDVLIVDQLGVLQSLYELAEVAFIGGSLLPKIGGHTPYEPIRAGTAVVSGPYFDNFSAEYTALEEKGGCLIAAENALAKSLAEAFETAGQLAAQAAAILPPFDAPEELFAKVSGYLDLSE